MIFIKIWTWLLRLMRRSVRPAELDETAVDSPTSGISQREVNDHPHSSQFNEPAVDTPDPTQAEADDVQDTPETDKSTIDTPDFTQAEADDVQDSSEDEEAAADTADSPQAEADDVQDSSEDEEAAVDIPDSPQAEAGGVQDSPEDEEAAVDIPDSPQAEADGVQDSPEDEEAAVDTPDSPQAEADGVQDSPEDEEAAVDTPDSPQAEADGDQDSPEDEEAAVDTPDSPQAEADGVQDSMQADDEIPTDAARREKTPRDIPGRRVTSRNEPKGGGATKFTPKPELICRKPRGSWQWEVILSVPHERNVAWVRQGDKEIPAENHVYRPLSFYGSLVVEYDGGNDDEIPLFVKDPLIFKLRNDWQGDGRRVRDITRGHFIVIAPHTWTRSGHARVSPEGCLDTSYTAHYFYIDREDETGDVGGFEEYQFSLARSGYALEEGKRIHDDSQEGELFVGAAPVLKPANGIVWARVGEEAHNGWEGESFRPAEKRLGDVLGQRQGRFYVRVYNERVELVDSGEFRYCAGLQEIRVNCESYSRDMLLAPSPDGHSPTTLQFVDAEGSVTSAALKGDSTHISVRPDGVVDVAPHPDGDEMTWSLWPCGSMDAVIRLPRIWWRMVRPDESPDGWLDMAVSMSRDEFREQSYAEAEIEIRVPSSIKNVRAGFGSGNGLDQSFPAEAQCNLRQSTLPLDAFVDYIEIDEPSAEDTSLKIRCGDVEIVLVHIIPDLPPPEPELPQPMPEPPPQPSEKPRAYVKCPDGSLRYGKGFSHGELLRAGLTAVEADQLSIHVDRRRSSVHSINVDTLHEVKDDA